MYTYFVATPDLVKIGKTRNPWTRIAGICAASPVEIEFLGITTEHEEAELPLMFASVAVRGEWFRRTTELERFIKAIARPLPERPALGIRRFNIQRPDGRPWDVDDPATWFWARETAA